MDENGDRAAGKLPIITPRSPVRHREAWREALADAITDPAELLSRLELDPDLLPAARRAARLFGLRVPRCFADLMERGNPADPLLRQVLPLAAEARDTPGFGPDPVGDLAAGRGPGILQKYHGRALLLATGACAVNCRYCFRRSFPYADMALTPARLRAATERLQAFRELDEVILSGGDPLALPTARLADISRSLAGLPAVRRLRIHTRTPVVLPRRVDRHLLDWLANLPWKRVVVLHVNHPREISPAFIRAAAELAGTGTTLLNQSVLLAGVNDDAGVLEALSRDLFDAGILPYYLHMLDPVAGAAHFQVPEDSARRLYESLRRRLPGYLVPELVREEAGAPYKVPIVSPFAPENGC
ncbi:MAG: EF-P beta-lysylation protein EpmB [Gammaproteobacteria bacterium]